MNNNPRFDTGTPAGGTGTKSPEAIRSEIDETRRRMDDTIDALSSRLKGRHLVDEVLGFIRSRASSNGHASSNDGPSAASQIGTKVAESASTAMHSVLDTVKAHPIPALLIGTGIGWMVYESRRAKNDSANYDPDLESYRASDTGWDDDVPYDYSEGELSLGQDTYPSATNTSAAAGFTGGADISTGNDLSTSGGKMQQMKNSFSERATTARDRLQQRTSDLRRRGQEQSRVLGQRMQAGYTATRERLVTTVDSHPLESGLACLALGVIAGMLIPTPRAVTQMTGPTANRLAQRARETSRELIERGKHVAQAAAEAARREAESQGLTPEALRGKAAAVANQARQAATDTAQKEGVPLSGSGSGAGASSGQSSAGTGNSGF